MGDRLSTMLLLQGRASVLLLAAYACGCGTPTFEPDASRVVNGQDARPHSWPWQITLQVKRGSRFHHICGGTLIGPRWVLTAAHCILDGQVSRVVLGEHNLSQQEGTEQIRDILRTIVHPDWDDRVSNGNDLALLKLDKAPIMTDSVGLACLPEAGEMLAHGTACYVSGWGRLYTNGPIPDILQQALLPVVEHSVCSSSEWWGPLNCKGQDGRWYVHGVTSFVSNRQCNEVKKPTVFTRNSAFSAWISDIMLHS